MGEDELLKTFSDNLRQLIIKKGITQTELAASVNVSPSTITYWMCGRKMPRVRKLDELCRYFGIERTELLNKATMTTTAVLLNDEEKQLISNYRKLAVTDQNITKHIISAFLTRQIAAGLGNILQNNTIAGNLFANNGDNYVAS